MRPAVKELGLLGGIAVCAALAFLLVRRSGGTPASVPSATAEREPVGAVPLGVPVAVERVDRSADAGRLAVPTVAGEPVRGIRVRAYRPDDRPAAGVGITVLPLDGRHPDLHARRRASDATGLAWFGEVEPGRYGVWADRSARAWARPEDRRKSGRRSIVLPPIDVASLDGIMVSERASPMAAVVSTPRLESLVVQFEDVRTTVSGELVVLSTAEVGSPAVVARPDCRLSSALPDRLPAAVVEVGDGVVVVELRIENGLAARGRVVAADGRVVPGAEVWVVHDGGRSAFVAATAGADGAFAIEEFEPGSTLFARANGHATSKAVSIEDGATPVELVLGPRAAAIAGRVLGPDGRPVARARVRVGDPCQDEARRVQVPTDADGRFRVPAPALGEVPVLVLAPGCQPWLGTAVVGAERDASLLVQLRPGAIVTGRVLGPDGAPRGDVVVRATCADLPDTDVHTGPEGSFRLECAPLGPFAVVVDEADDHRGARQDIVGVAGIEQHVELALGRYGRIRGRVVDANAEPLARVTVRALASVEGAAPVAATTGADGAFELRTLPEASYRIEVYPEPAGARTVRLRGRGDGTFAFLLTMADSDDVAGRRTVACTWLGSVPADCDGLEVRLPEHAIASAHLRGRALGPDGSPLSGVVVVRVGEGHRTVRLDQDGRFAVGPLVPGGVQLEVRPDDAALAPFDLPITSVSAGQTVDVGDAFARAR